MDCRAKPEECLPFTLALSSKYDVLCEAGCAAWSKAGAKGEGREGEREEWSAVYEGLIASQEKCQETCLAHRAQVPGSWDEAYVLCVEREGKAAVAPAAAATSPFLSSPSVWQHLARVCWNPALPPVSSCPVAAVAAAAPLFSLSTLQVLEVGNGSGGDNKNDNGSSSESSNSTDDDPAQAGSKEGGGGAVKVSAGELIGFVISAALLTIGIVCGVIRFGKYLLQEGGLRRAEPLSSGRSSRSGSGGSMGGSWRGNSRGLPLLDVREDEERGEEDEEGEGRERRVADLY